MFFISREEDLSYYNTMDDEKVDETYLISHFYEHRIFAASSRFRLVNVAFDTTTVSTEEIVDLQLRVPPNVFILPVFGVMDFIQTLLSTTIALNPSNGRRTEAEAWVNKSIMHQFDSECIVSQFADAINNIDPNISGDEIRTLLECCGSIQTLASFGDSAKILQVTPLSKRDAQIIGRVLFGEEPSSSSINGFPNENELW